jgi:hypothetical protein
MGGRAVRILLAAGKGERDALKRHGKLLRGNR